MLALLLLACSTPEPTPAPPAAELAQPAPPSETTYGDALTGAERLSVKALLADASAHVGKTVQVEGHITDVCQKAGCWMVLTEEDQLLRVTMKDHSFSVDKNGAGATAICEGTVVEVPADPETVAHYQSEAREKGAIPEANTAGSTYQLVASAVQIRR